MGRGDSDEKAPRDGFDAMLCEAKLPFLFSLLSSLFTLHFSLETTI